MTSPTGTYANMGAKKDEKGSGVWLDLSKHAYYFLDEMSRVSEGRKSRRRKRKSDDSYLGSGLESDLPAAPLTARQAECMRMHGKARSPDDEDEVPKDPWENIPKATIADMSEQKRWKAYDNSSKWVHHATNWWETQQF